MRTTMETMKMKTTTMDLILEGAMKGIFVTPAKAGVQVLNLVLKRSLKAWIPACAGMALLCSTGLQAASKGTSGAQFLRIGVGARGPGMAGAFSPIADDASSIFWNPAGLARMDKREVQVSYNAYFKDTASQFIAYGHPTAERGTFGAS